MHVLPRGFHRIRHYGLLASGNRDANIAQARTLLAVPARSERPDRPMPLRLKNRVCSRVRVPAAVAA